MISFKISKISYRLMLPTVVLLALLLLATLWSCNPVVSEGVRKKDLNKDVELVTEMGSIVIRLSDETPKHRNNFIRLVNQHELDSLDFYRVIQTFLIQTGKDLTEEYPATIDAEFRPTLFHKRGAVNAARNGDDENPQQASANIHFTIIQGRVFTDSMLTKAEERINNWLAYNKVINDPANTALFHLLQQYNTLSTNDDSLTLIQSQLDSLTKIKKSEIEPYRIPDDHREVYKTIGGAPHLDQNYTVFGEVVKGMEVVDTIAAIETDNGDKPLNKVLILTAKLIERSY